MIDKSIFKELFAHFEEDLNHCERITNFRWKKRDSVKRALEVIVRPFRQQL